MAYLARLLAISGDRHAAATTVGPSTSGRLPTATDLEVHEIREIGAPPGPPQHSQPASPAPAGPTPRVPSHGSADAATPDSLGRAATSPDRQRSMPIPVASSRAEGRRTTDASSPLPQGGRTSLPDPSSDGVVEPSVTPEKPVTPTGKEVRSSSGEADDLGRFREALEQVRRWIEQPEPNEPADRVATTTVRATSDETTSPRTEPTRSRQPAGDGRHRPSQPVEKTVEISIGTVDVIIDNPPTAPPSQSTVPSRIAQGTSGTTPLFNPARHYLRI